MAGEMVIVGMGPGGPEYLSPAALAAIQAAECLIGSSRWLERYGANEQELAELDKDLDALRLKLIAWEDRRVAILVSGDPGFFSLLDWVRREFPERDVKVVPGISSMQLGFACFGQSWHDCRFISLHGRVFPDLKAIAREAPKLCLLTDAKNTPATIIHRLREAGFSKKRVFIGSELGSEHEATWQGRPADYPADGLNNSFSVVIIVDESLDPGDAGNS
jgi:cobalt-precorrin-7 (C5)-methyltransferase